MNPIKRILVPTDFSELASTTLDYARSLKATYGAKVFLMHVVDNVPVFAYHTIDLASDMALEDACTGAGHELQEYARMMGEDTETVVRRGDASFEIVRFAKEARIDLIVMATHGRTGLAHVVMGSVAEKVVQHSPVPVFIVKAHAAAETMKGRAEFPLEEHAS